jgi:hypothetical protein
LDATSLLDLVRAQWRLIWALVLVRTVPRGQLLRPEGWPEAAGHPGAEVEASARRLALALGRVAEHGLFRPTCLVRSIALQRWMRSSGIRGGRVRVGVRLHGREFAAHAWVEVGDLILGDAEWHVRSFTPLSGLERVDGGSSGAVPRTARARRP